MQNFLRILGFDNSREWWTKLISLLGSFLTLYFSCRWLFETKEWEPFIAVTGLIVTIVTQCMAWKTFRRYEIKQTSRHELSRDDNIYDKILNLSAYTYKFIVSPISTPYWRWGLKFSNDYNFPIPGRVIKGCPLFHLTDSNDGTLAVSYYDEQKTMWDKGVNEISNHYDGETIEVIVSFDVNHINISITKEGEPLFNHPISSKYFFARIIAWADNEPFEINTIINEYKRKEI